MLSWALTFFVIALMTAAREVSNALVQRYTTIQMVLPTLPPLCSPENSMRPTAMLQITRQMPSTCVRTPPVSFSLRRSAALIDPPSMMSAGTAANVSVR